MHSPGSLSSYGPVSPCLMPKGQADPGGPLIDRNALARSFLLCPQGLRASSSLSFKPRIHTGLINGDETAVGWGGCTGTYVTKPWTEVQGIGVNWAGPEGGGGGGGGCLINGSCFGPNTQLGDLTKCSVSSPPLFFCCCFFSPARHNVCPRLREGEVGRGGGGEGWGGSGSRSERLFSSSLTIN